MCRLIGWISDEPRSLRDVLGDAALDRFANLSGLHGHGWGTATLDPSTAHLATHHSTRPAREDPDFQRLADIPSRLGLFHLRWATPGLARNRANTHPFVDGDRAMIHNGAIQPIDRLPMLRRQGSKRQPIGTTDSERLFLAVLDELRPAGAGTTGEQLAAAIETISDRAVTAGLTAASLNSIFVGPRGMAVLNWHDPAKVPSIDADDPSSPPYYDLRHLHGAGLDVIASSGFVSDPQTWSLLPNACLLSIGFDKAPQELSIRPAKPLCPIPAEAIPNAG